MKPSPSSVGAIFHPSGTPAACVRCQEAPAWKALYGRNAELMKVVSM